MLPAAFGQEIQEKVNVELVQVDLVATDSKGEVIRDLTANDFTLKENGKVQSIKHFYNSSDDSARFPLTLSFLVDTSYSMHEKVAGMTRIDVAVKAAEMVINELQPNDQIELTEFNDKPETLVPFTSDVNEIREKFKALTFQEANTAMNDSVLYAVKRIQGRNGRKIIVIFSDGMDSSSKSVEEDVVDAVRKSDATIIAFYSELAAMNFSQGGGIGAMAGPNPISRVKILAGEDILREYAEMTGGQFFSFRKEPELLKAMNSFRNYVGSQYTLAYTPPEDRKAKTGWRKIKIECKRKGVHLRYREGYVAG